MQTARVFMSGNSQAVRLPREFRIDDEEVIIRRVGSTILLTPLSDPWATFRESLSAFSEDYLSDGRQQPETDDRDRPDVSP